MNVTSPSQVKAWCIANGFHPSRALGQNFLIDLNIRDAIVRAAGIAPGARILEIGPGLGALTEGLLAAGARVTAVEKDARLAGRLAPALGSPAALRVLAADALTLDWDGLLADGFPACVSNLPYSVGTRILLDLAFRGNAPGRFVLLVQTEVAGRFAAGPGSPARGQAGVWLQLDYDVTTVREVRPSCFWPRPEVSSTVVRLDRRPCFLPAAARPFFFLLSRHAFMHRRKQLGTILRAAPGALACPEAEAARRIERAGLDPRIRPEALGNAQWQALARVYAEASA